MLHSGKVCLYFETSDHQEELEWTNTLAYFVITKRFCEKVFCCMQSDVNGLKLFYSLSLTEEQNKLDRSSPQTFFLASILLPGKAWNIPINGDKYLLQTNLFSLV